MERAGPPPDELSSIRSAVEWAIATRRSVRAYLPKPVPHETIKAILDVSRYAATGVNIQPWKVHVVMGDARDRVCAAIAKVDNDPELADAHADEWAYYPEEWVSPYIDRRRDIGWKLYGLLGIEKGDKQRMHAQHGRNYQFFDAPGGLFFTIDRVMQRGSLLDARTHRCADVQANFARVHGGKKVLPQEGHQRQGQQYEDKEAGSKN